MVVMWRFFPGGSQNRPRHYPLENGINNRKYFQLCHQYIANYNRNPNIFFALAIAVLILALHCNYACVLQAKVNFNMINLYNCRCSARNATAPAFLKAMCICPRTWAIPGIGKVIISFSGISLSLKTRPQGVPVVRMLWWHQPKSCPSFRSKKELTGISLLPIISPRVYTIFRRKKRRANR